MTRTRLGFVASAAVAVVGVAGVAAFASDPQLSFIRGDVEVSPTRAQSQTVHLPTPKPLYAIYMTQCAVGTPSLRDSLVQFIDDTKLNAVVIDIKDYTGMISFPTNNLLLSASVSNACGADDMKEFIERLHEKDIYVIGRITVFQDPFYTKNHPEQSVQSKSRPGEPWKDYKGLSFVAVNALPFWEYIFELSKESYALGFDELNYDYIRWPSDGAMSDVAYPSANRAEELEKFFRYLSENIKSLGVVISADLFGMTTTNTDDLNIGQQLERTLPYFDYIAPMVYPSHYPRGFNGYAKVNEHAYGIVHFSLAQAVRRTIATTTSVYSFAYERIGTSTPAVYSKPSYDAKKMRPWLQSFDYPVPYTPAMVAAQIQANADADLDSYMFWDPANRYTSLRQVLQSENDSSGQE